MTTLLHLYLFSINPKGLERCMNESKGAYEGGKAILLTPSLSYRVICV